VLPDKRRAHWLLKRRDVYVLAAQPHSNTQVLTDRLRIGRSDAVLCKTELAPEVEALLIRAGCEGYIKFDEELGVPRGWAGFRKVVPQIPVPLEPGTDKFYALKPAPDIEIEFEGGVCLRNSAYLAGYPPQIKVYGQHAGEAGVFIDGKAAQLTPGGAFRADGYASPGPHIVDCPGSSCSRSYSIEEAPDHWAEWPAYSFGQADVCGALVRPKDSAANERLFSVPMSNPLLLGAEPGQVFYCSRRKAAYWKGFVPFDVVWALPAQPLTCNKKVARILQFGNVLPIVPEWNERQKRRTRPALAWSRLILDAARKGLRIESTDPCAALCWCEYKKAAHDIRRAKQ
jgi:hypothetical protein